MKKNNIFKINDYNLYKNYKKHIINNFKIDICISLIIEKYGHIERNLLFNTKYFIKTAGRIFLKREIGKVIFITLQDIHNNIQLYLSRDFLVNFKLNNILNIGDIIGVKGYIFKTKTNELSINCSKIYFLSKSLKKLPDKFKGLSDIEIRSKKRYLDLISNNKSRKIFILRSKIILEIRKYLSSFNFIEVETPIMQSIPGGATAKPFITKFNSLNKNFYLRISPELYLKKLIVGGFNKIFEIGKSFRNEGISSNHNPEFTILELYNTYADYHYLMKFIQNMIKYICLNIFNNTIIVYKNTFLDFEKKFNIISMKDSIYKFNNIKNLNIDNINDCFKYAKSLDINIKKNYKIGEIQFYIFKKTVEHNLIQPTFITEYPIDISPLSKKNIFNNNIADRFELFIYGLEIGNGFSELNDAEDQHNRFIEQIDKHNKNEKYNFYDKYYIDALKYGLPPTAGVGIGIDRLIMLLTNTVNIRDVILFPDIRYKN